MVVVVVFAFAFPLVALLVPATVGDSSVDEAEDEDAAEDAAIQAAVVDVEEPIIIGVVDAPHCFQTWGNDNGRCRPASSLLSSPSKEGEMAGKDVAK